MFEKILFPTDFSEVSLHALENCIPTLFDMGAKELIVVHVIDIIPEDIKAMEVLEKSAREKLDVILDILRDGGIKVSGITCFGNPPSKIASEAKCPSIEIVEKATCEQVDLIVIPSRGKNIMMEKFLGSTAKNVIRNSSVPILLLKYEWNKDEESIECITECRENMFEKPLITIDFSESSEKIVNAIGKIEDKIKEGVLFHVIDYGSSYEFGENAKKALSDLEVYEKQFSFPVEKEVDFGIAFRNILNEALAKKSTVIVVGRVKKGPLREIVIGSTADAVIGESKLPVLVVPGVAG